MYHTGAGISVHAGIPDFRSSEGLFRTIKKENPREGLGSGKDLFDAAVFHVSIIFLRGAFKVHWSIEYSHSQKSSL